MTDPTTSPYAAYVADSQEDHGQENILAKITRVARELREAQADVATAEASLKTAQDRVRVIEETVLPGLMDEAQQEKLRTTDGYDLERGETLRASIPPSNMPQAVMWLNANGCGAIVKRLVSVQFGKGEEQKAAQAVAAITEAGFVPTDKLSVHPQTLAATVRELLADGKEVPLELLGAYVQPWVKVKPVKK